MVQQWFTEEFAVEQHVHDDTTGKSKNTEDDIDVSDAIEVIRWYQFFVAAKVFRALMGALTIRSLTGRVGGRHVLAATTDELTKKNLAAFAR